MADCDCGNRLPTAIVRCCASLKDARAGDTQVEILAIRHVHQPVERRVAKHGPPAAVGGRIVRTCGLPSSIQCGATGAGGRR